MSWLMNLISGWLPVGVNSSGEKKPFGEWAGKIVWVVGIYAACYFLSMLFFKPQVSNTTIQKGATQIIQQGEQRDVVGFGCNAWRMYIRTGIKTK